MKHCKTCIHYEICNLHHNGTEAQECKHFTEGEPSYYIIHIFSKRSTIHYTSEYIFKDLNKVRDYIQELEDRPSEVHDMLYVSDIRVYTIKQYKLI